MRLAVSIMNSLTFNHDELETACDDRKGQPLESLVVKACKL
jgi:hypothetical protein